MNETLKVMEARRSCRNFDKKKWYLRKILRPL